MAYEEVILQGLIGGALGSLILASIGIAIIILAGVYVYFALAWMVIGDKLKHPYPWLAWIPFARDAMVLQLGGFHWAWVFLFLIPIFGWIALLVLGIIAKWKIFIKRKYPGWLSLLILIPQAGLLAHAIIIGFVAWKDNK